MPRVIPSISQNLAILSSGLLLRPLPSSLHMRRGQEVWSDLENEKMRNGICSEICCSCRLGGKIVFTISFSLSL
jgi:hypothetical protein